MREHILSNSSEKRMMPEMQPAQYSFKEQINLSTLDAGGDTWITKATEISDPDEFYLIEGSFLTHAVETSDPDEFHMAERSGLTEAIEQMNLECSK